MADDFSIFQSASGGSEQAAPTDEFAQFEGAEPTMGEKAETFIKTALGGAVEYSGIVPGAMKGAALAAPIPIPGARVAGAIAGGVTAWYAGSKAREVLADTGVAVESVEDLPKELRPYGYAGESFGGSIGVGGAVTVSGKMGYQTAGKTAVSRLLNSMFKTSATTKGIVVETSAAVSASVGAGVAETYAPGETGTRVASEIGGGLFNPTRLVIATTNAGVDLVKKVITAISPSAQETAAGKLLREVLENHGEDPQLIVRLLTESGMEGVGKQTMAQKTGSPTLAALERKLSEYSAQFGTESAAMADEGLKSLSTMAEVLFRTGDPDALKAVAQLKTQYIRTLLAGRIQSAEREAYEAVIKITLDTPGARAEISTLAKKALGDALKEARSAETELWNAVDKASTSGVDSLVVRFKNIKADMLPEVRGEKLPSVVSRFIKRVTKVSDDGTIAGTNAGEMMQLRSELLESGREASKAGKYGQARIFNELADSVLDDLDAAFSGVAGDAYDTARVFSRELNETFSNSFAGKALSTGRYGDNIAPEILLRKSLAGGKEASELQLGELEEATRFMLTRGLTDDTSFQTMMHAQDRIIRLAAADMIDPETGKVGIKQVSKFIRDNEALLSRFPEIKDDLVKAVTTESVRKNLEASVKNSTRVIESQTVLGKLAKGDPVEMAHKALTSLDQEKELMALIKIAKKGGAEAKHGLKTSVFDAAIRKATTESGHIQLDKLKHILYNSSVTGRKAPIEVLKDSGIFTRGDINQIDELFKAVDNIMTAKKPGTAVELPDGVGDTLIDFAERIFGASVAGKAGQVTGSQAHPLIIASAGSRAARTIFNKIPTAKVRTVLIQAMTDPELMKRLLLKTENAQQAVEKTRQIHAYLISSGMYNVEKAINPDEPR